MEQCEAALPGSRAGSGLPLAEPREGFRPHTAAGSIPGGRKTLTLRFEAAPVPGKLEVGSPLR